ncbi:nickel pincer cofactor biosynthesis protein LarB [Ancylobacter dichloromethanicus]|uniref:1-(5-phosphoribosyl)-5-amino-4-imidazole-carboxyl ate carboxylase n=1 Tax=Ancylobacter dichloromethanicus TaxID=518825 RepID=A0A9W6J8T1_9HYPH|nr:nickel pincer cofactor biosynthesis protein LarB [Ancylobacter dichloromethanicus]MBS7553210.1 nickel pincer cofactor biosynthesis protein LarB [Ancylobacter dichloromethanicus]GLK72990.1 1-(5-phosphoribosyl)-5-amino-4-imidazole-carboxyl ate carboxylase [Ancylobacter dichloromethanicus]
MDFTFDWQRAARTGLPEAVLCSAKSPAQLAEILAAARARSARLLLTRLEPAGFAALDAQARSGLDYDAASRTAVLGGPVPLAAASVAVVAAGTSDLPVAREAAQTLAFSGEASLLVADVGVAGLWRLMARIEEIRRFRVVIAVAGMEGALFSVLGGLVSAPVIAVPCSVGYGVAEGGRAALASALASCAPGVVAVNIDNGYGAACAALKMLGAAATGREEP